MQACKAWTSYFGQKAFYCKMVTSIFHGHYSDEGFTLYSTLHVFRKSFIRKLQTKWLRIKILHDLWRVLKTLLYTEQNCKEKMRQRNEKAQLFGGRKKIKTTIWARAFAGLMPAGLSKVTGCFIYDLLASLSERVRSITKRPQKRCRYHPQGHR